MVLTVRRKCCRVLPDFAEFSASRPWIAPVFNPAQKFLQRFVEFRANLLIVRKALKSK